MSTPPRTIEIAVGTVSAQFELLSRTAPRTTAALWDSLPVEGAWTHARWAGAACWVKVDQGPIAAVTEVEFQATSIYRGTLVVRPGKGNRVELYLAYGQAESRHERGRTYTTPVAKVVGDPTALYGALAETWKGGSAPAQIRRVESGSAA
jgi:hypothetical protein